MTHPHALPLFVWDRRGQRFDNGLRQLDYADSQFGVAPVEGLPVMGVKYQRSKAVLVRRMGDEMVLLDTNSEGYFALNAVGALIFETLRNPGTMSDVVNQVLDTFDVDRERAESDVASLIGDLVERGILEPASEDG